MSEEMPSDDQATLESLAKHVDNIEIFYAHQLVLNEEVVCSAIGKEQYYHLNKGKLCKGYMTGQVYYQGQIACMLHEDFSTGEVKLTRLDGYDGLMPEKGVINYGCNGKNGNVVLVWPESVKVTKIVVNYEYMMGCEQNSDSLVTIE